MACDVGYVPQAAAVVAQLVLEEGLKVCVTHGNGPQVGLLALQVGGGLRGPAGLLPTAPRATKPASQPAAQKR